MAQIFSEVTMHESTAQNPTSITAKNENQTATDSQVVYLLCELEAAKTANKNLKVQLKAVQAELNNLKMTPEPASSRYCPGVISAMVSEIYHAQRERDDAMMSRIRLANDERDEALYRLDKLKGKYNELLVFDEQETNKDNELDMVQLSSLNDADFILNNESAIVRDVAQRKRKPLSSKESLQSLNLEKDDDENTDSNEDVRTCSSLPKSFNSPSDDSKLDPEVHLRLVQQRLSEEMQAKEEAQATCQRLERLVEVLRRKVNGLTPQKSESLTDDL